MAHSRPKVIHDEEVERKRGVARDKDSGTIQGSDDGPPEAVPVNSECSLLQWGARGTLRCL